MFGIGMPELLVILAVALIVLGPKRLPEVARTIGKAMNEFRRATSGITEEFESARSLLEEESRKVERAARMDSLPAPKPGPAQPPTGENPAESLAPAPRPEGDLPNESPPKTSS